MDREQKKRIAQQLAERFITSCAPATMRLLAMRALAIHALDAMALGSKQQAEQQVEKLITNIQGVTHA